MFKAFWSKIKTQKETKENKETKLMVTNVNLTRVYKLKDTGQVKTQKVSVDRGALTSVRASNRLPGQRATITIAGAELEVAETFSEVKALFGIRN